MKKKARFKIVTQIADLPQFGRLATCPMLILKRTVRLGRGLGARIRIEVGLAMLMNPNLPLPLALNLSPNLNLHPNLALLSSSVSRVFFVVPVLGTSHYVGIRSHALRPEIDVELGQCFPFEHFVVHAFEWE